MPLRVDPEAALDAFSNLTDPQDPELLWKFVEDHFEAEGKELLPWTPADYQDRPAGLMAIQDPSRREWAFALNRLWVTLCRVQDAAVAAAPQRYTALPQRFPTVIPGGRFRETYYWDTYWIVRGLLACEMVGTARGLVENLLDCVRSYGFVPNGARMYYLDRSQPPMLSEMVLAVHEAAPDSTWLAEVLPLLEAEYSFWMDPEGGRLVTLLVEGGEVYHLNVFSSSCSGPRPESYTEDLVTATEGVKLHNRRAEDVYLGLRAGAETGWDFSSRWLASGLGGCVDLSTINTSAVVPIDLNCVLYRVEQNLAKLHRLAGGAERVIEAYELAAVRRRAAMDALLWSQESGTYRDFRLDGGFSSKVGSLVDFAAPLWAGLYGHNRGCGKDAAAAVDGLTRSGFLQPGGCVTSLLHSGQQWDAPNAWAPLQLMIIEGLDSLRKEAPCAGKMADELAEVWLRSCYQAWHETGLMCEKYNAMTPGEEGGGGEYEPQVGFGWSNGVALALLARAQGGASGQQVWAEEELSM